MQAGQKFLQTFFQLEYGMICITRIRGYENIAHYQFLVKQETTT